MESGIAEYEVPEPTALTPVGFTPAAIDADTYLADRRGRVEALMEPYRNLDDRALAIMSERDMRACRTDINRIIREVDNERRAIKRAYSEPLRRFEDQVKSLLEPARAASEQLKTALDKKAELAREARYRELEGTYESYAPVLVPIVPFEHILELNPKWLNATYGMQKAKEEIADTVDGIAQDWETLKAQADMMGFFEEAEAEFFRTLDIRRAVEFNAMREREQVRLDAMKADIAANQGADSRDDPSTPAPTSTPAKGPERRGYIIHIDLTDRERDQLIAWIQEQQIGSNRRITLQ